MTVLGKILRVSTALGAFALVISTAHAEGTGKIYVGGAWKEAKATGAPLQAQSFLGNLFGQKSALNLTELVHNFLTSNASLLNVDRGTSWGVTQQQTSDQLQTQRINKTWMGLPVLGGDAVIHVAQGQVAFANADNTNLAALSNKATVSPEEARSIAFSSYAGRALYTSAPQLKVLILGQGANKEPKLVYEVTVRDRDQLSSDIHFIDAQTAQELMVTTNVETLADRSIVVGLGSEDDFNLDETQWKVIYADKGCSASQPSFGGGQQVLAAGPTPCGTFDARLTTSATDAWNNAQQVYDYYSKNHKRDSIDGKGMTIRSVVNFGGEGFKNAAWYNDKSIMLYGFVNDAQFNDFAAPLDVAAHELTHGVTSRTANLAYASESGALNESYSDVFGKLVAFRSGQKKDWKIGKELFTDGTRFVRDLENPTIGNTADFAYRDEPCTRFNDYCGVHQNSGIPSKAAVYIAKKLGLDKLEKIYYLTLTQLLRTNSDFAETKAQSEAACATLYGAGSADCQAVTEGFASVGI